MLSLTSLSKLPRLLALTSLATVVMACSQRSQPSDAPAEIADAMNVETVDATMDATDATMTVDDSGDATVSGDAMDGALTGMDATVDGDAGLTDTYVFQVPSLGDAACSAVITPFPIQESPHVDFDAAMYDAAIMWNSNPPSSGPHFGLWAYWGIYTTPIPRGYYTHNLEHGGVVLSYRCASRNASAQCMALHDALAAFANGLPPEPACAGSGVRRRIIVTPDPLISTTVAGSAWGYTYNANCVDTRSLEIYVLGLGGRAPEDFCADGFYPEVPPPPVDAGRDGG